MKLNRGLIGSDKARRDEAGFQQLKTELTQAFAALDTAYRQLDAEAVINRNKP